MHTATHTTKSRKYLYRIEKAALKEKLSPLFFGGNSVVQFWDAHCEVWRDSVISKRKLIRIDKATFTTIICDIEALRV
jgi:hypothetical protein